MIIKGLNLANEILNIGDRLCVSFSTYYLSIMVRLVCVGLNEIFSAV